MPVRICWCPDAKVFDGVHVGDLAHGGLGGPSAAVVGARLLGLGVVGEITGSVSSGIRGSRGRESEEEEGQHYGRNGEERGGEGGRGSKGERASGKNGGL